MFQSLWGSWIFVGVGALSTGVANVLLKSRVYLLPKRDYLLASYLCGLLGR